MSLIVLVAVTWFLKLVMSCKLGGVVLIFACVLEQMNQVYHTHGWRICCSLGSRIANETFLIELLSEIHYLI